MTNERKSIGAFITALRKANGLTQRDLAEKINVSDKTISRWERDENAPDLSAIPVLAEIFGVTCDELLCGERKRAAETPGDEPIRKTKQMKRVLEDTVHQLTNKTYITATVVALGMVAGMIANFGFLQARIGFFVSLLFFLVAGVHQAICANNAFYALKTDAFLDEQLASYKERLFHVNTRVVLMIFTAVLSMLPFLCLVEGTHVGVTSSTYFSHALIIIVVAFGLYKVLLQGLMTKIALRKGFLFETSTIAKQQRLQKCKNRAFLITTALCVLTLLTQFLYNGTYSPKSFAPHQSFFEIEGFVNHMEMEMEGEEAYQNANSMCNDQMTEPVQLPDEMKEKEKLKTTIKNPEGEVVSTFSHNNQAVVSWTIYWLDGEFSEARTYTKADFRVGENTFNQRGHLLNLGYLFSIFLGCVYYFFARGKYLKGISKT